MDDKPKKQNTLSKNVKLISAIGLTLSLIGIAVATYLTIAHYATKVSLVCPDTGFINCTKVTSSSYSEVYGIPAAVLGLVFFIGMLILQLPMLWKSSSILLRRLRLAYSIIGLCTVFWFVFVEFHRLDAICLYCSAVHVLTFCLFVVTLIGSSIISPATDKDLE
jgi:uncharacterized membrane protein